MWVSTAKWPGFSRYDQDNLDAIGNGLSISPSTYQTVTLSDYSGDGLISDTDSDDSSTFSGDRIIVGTVSHSVREVAAYVGSTVTVDGTTYTNVKLAVTLFDDGTYGVRIHDDSMPDDAHFKKVTQIKLGTFNGVEYTAVKVANIDDPFICFAAGTLIDTAHGARRVESLAPGDLVPTLDHGLQPLRWVGRRQVSGRGKMAPVRFAIGAMGNDRALRLSTQHRVLLRGWRAKEMFGSAQVLVPALHLINDLSIRRAPCDAVTYVHLLFDRHEIISSSGLLSESFYPATYGMSLLDAPTRAEVFKLFPELGADFSGYGPTARPCLRRWQTRLLLTD
ncbi:MAG: Hint domain-containing protein [Rhodobacteraceae bacterium]|nr:Hint domain-containing protein [Paracoccaceae bacterium]